jgi:hypothetical protein
MIHQLTIGHLDPAAIRDSVAVALRPLDMTKVSEVLAEFPGLKVEQRDGYLIAPWHGREDAERGEAFAARIQAETGCLVADRRNGRIVQLEGTARSLRAFAAEDRHCALAAERAVETGAAIDIQ